MPSPRSRAAGLLNRILRWAGLELRQLAKEPIPVRRGLQDLDPWVADIIEQVRPFTMTSDERIAALCYAVRYVVRFRIPGDIVECGVWRGGSMMAAALALLAQGDASRSLYLFDTFEGMPPPTNVDREAASGKLASALLADADRLSNIWACAQIEEVQVNLASTGYPPANIHLIAGKVEDTIPLAAPPDVSILRLDTDWYESTRHELIHLYPRLALGGALIVDDYGFWLGARKAVDEYFDQNRIPVLLNRIDETGRIAVKLNLP
jgi:hypothetical protein